MSNISVIDLTRHVDDRGDLAELWRKSWMEVDDKPFEVNQVYTVFDPSPGTVRAYHRHERLWDLFHIASGSAKFHIVMGPSQFPVEEMPDGEEASDFINREGPDEKIITLSARKPQLLIVPPFYWHGWMSLEPNTLLISLASHEYNRDEPDEERIHPYMFGMAVWKVESK